MGVDKLVGEIRVEIRLIMTIYIGIFLLIIEIFQDLYLYLHDNTRPWALEL